MAENQSRYKVADVNNAVNSTTQNAEVVIEVEDPRERIGIIDIDVRGSTVTLVPDQTLTPSHLVDDYAELNAQEELVESMALLGGFFEFSTDVAGGFSFTWRKAKRGKVFEEGDFHRLITLCKSENGIG